MWGEQVGEACWMVGFSVAGSGRGQAASLGDRQKSADLFSVTDKAPTEYPTTFLLWFLPVVIRGGDVDVAGSALRAVLPSVAETVIIQYDFI